jgi:hypothetical protein
LKLNEGGNISEFVREYKDTINQLAAAGDTIAADDKVMTCLNALPDNMETFVQTILGRDDLISLEGLFNKLL